MLNYVFAILLSPCFSMYVRFGFGIICMHKSKYVIKANLYCYKTRTVRYRFLPHLHGTSFLSIFFKIFKLRMSLCLILK